MTLPYKNTHSYYIHAILTQDVIGNSWLLNDGIHVASEGLYGMRAT